MSVSASFAKADTGLRSNTALSYIFWAFLAANRISPSRKTHEWAAITFGDEAFVRPA